MLIHCVWLSNPNLLYAKDCCGSDRSIEDIIPTVVPRTTTRASFVFIDRIQELQYISDQQKQKLKAFIAHLLFIDIQRSSKAGTVTTARTRTKRNITKTKR